MKIEMKFLNYAIRSLGIVHLVVNLNASLEVKASN